MSAYWISYLIIDIIFYCIPLVLVAFLGVAFRQWFITKRFFSFPFPHSLSSLAFTKSLKFYSFGPTMVLFVLWGFAQISLGFFMSTLFTKERVATGTFSFFSSSFPIPPSLLLLFLSLPPFPPPPFLSIPFSPCIPSPLDLYPPFSHSFPLPAPFHPFFSFFYLSAPFLYTFPLFILSLLPDVATNWIMRPFEQYFHMYSY